MLHFYLFSRFLWVTKQGRWKQADAGTLMSEDIRTDMEQTRQMHPIEFIMLISAFVHHSQGIFQLKGIGSKTTTNVHF